MVPEKSSKSLQASRCLKRYSKTSCTHQPFGIRMRLTDHEAGSASEPLAAPSGSYADWCDESVWGGGNWLFAPSTNSK